MANHSLTAKIYLLLFLVVNLVQSYFTELGNDEAYYWYYSQHLDWGHFDHPPAISFLIAMGYEIFQNELGVRLLIVLATTLSLWLMYKIVNPKNHHLFFLLFFSILIANVGFMAVPDIPLLLTSTIFFFLLKNYLQNDSWKTSICLAITIAAMGYSKYHGIVILVSALLPNLFLAKRKSFWLMLFLATGLYFPHFYWQYINDFPTFRFHLFDRSSEPYTAMFILEYLGGQLLIFGPLVGFFLFFGAITAAAKDKFSRTMKWCFYGVFGFFLFTSFTGRVEPNWTIGGIVPLIYLGYNFIISSKKVTRIIKPLMVVTIILITGARGILMFDTTPIIGKPLADEFHDWQEWATDISKIAADRPVIFYNSYQRAAKYNFYTGKESFSINSSVYAGSEYDLQTEQQENLQGKEILLVNGASEKEEGIVVGGKMRIKTKIIKNLRFYNRVKIKLLNPPKKMKPNEVATLKISIQNPTDKTIDFIPNIEKQLQLQVLIFEYKKLARIEKDKRTFPLTKLRPHESQEVELKIIAPDKVGNYRYRVAIHDGLIDERNGNFQKLEVVE